MESETRQLSSPTTVATRRRSGRVSKTPQLYSSTVYSERRTKRKRPEDNSEVDVISSDDTSSSEEESSSDEPSHRRLVKRRGNSRRPSAKKPRNNGAAVSLALRPAQSSRSKKSRKPKSRVSAFMQEDGLYAEVFRGEKSIEQITTNWMVRFKEDESREVTDLFNFILRASGCSHKIDETVVEDPDHFTEKLAEIQEEYQAQNVTEYPLIAKGRGAADFKQSLVEFFITLIKSASYDVLFDNPLLMENIIAWVGTLTSAGNRPFRHTATVASLAIVSALCEVGREVTTIKAQIVRQLENEKSKARPNKGRLAEFQAKVKTFNTKTSTLESFINNWFDTVFVHRYRDVDPRIRVDCVQSLSHWIVTYPDVFFDGQYLRYLGWVLSDTNAATRLEVVRQLRLLFSDAERIGGLQTFTERFRSRIVEMATRDADQNVRSAAVELLLELREAGFLEPVDIDSIGRLIFDTELRVRRAVVAFFAENVSELFEEKLEALREKDALPDSVRERQSDEGAGMPNIDWLKLKVMAELLERYDSDEAVETMNCERGLGSNSYVLVATTGVESRFSLAAQVLCENDRGFEDLLNWKKIAPYLLYDHSTVSNSGGGKTGSNSERQFLQSCRLASKQDMILLEVLNVSVRHHLSQGREFGTDKQRHRRIKGQKQMVVDEEQEEATKYLATIIPKLLNKFGDQPATASAVLRLERALNLQIFQDLRQESTVFANILDDIKRQFLTHGSERVLAEASMALLHAKSYEDLEEITAGKVQALWEDTLTAFHTSTFGINLSGRRNMRMNALANLSNNVSRLLNLATISDCSEYLEASIGKYGSVKGSNRNSGATAYHNCENSVELLLLLCERGNESNRSGGSGSRDMASMESSLQINACKTLAFYFFWQVKKLSTSLSSGTSGKISSKRIDSLATYQQEYFLRVKQELKSRRGADEVRCAFLGAGFDVACAFGTLRQFRAEAGEEPGNWQSLIREIDKDIQNSAIQVLHACEKGFARRSGKTLEIDLRVDTLGGDGGDERDREANGAKGSQGKEPNDEEDEEDEDEDEGGEGDEEDQCEIGGDEERQSERLKKTLLAEQRLCDVASKLVLALAAELIDERIKERLERNKNRLGPNFKEVVSFFEKKAATGKGSRASGTAKNGSGVSKRSGGGGRGGKEEEQKLVLEDDDIEEVVDRIDEVEGREKAEEAIVEGEDEEDVEMIDVRASGSEEVEEEERNGDEGEGTEGSEPYEAESVLGD